MLSIRKLIFSYIIEMCIRDSYIVIQAVDINNMVAGMSPPVIAEIWLHDANFRRIFKRMTYMSRYIHFEESLQSLIPWCFVNIKEYCKRFDGIQQENLLKMCIRDSCTGTPDIIETTFAISSSPTIWRSSFKRASHSAFISSKRAENSFS